MPRSQVCQEVLFTRNTFATQAACQSRRQSRSAKWDLKGHKQSTEKSTEATSRTSQRKDSLNKASDTASAALPRVSKEVHRHGCRLNSGPAFLGLIARTERQNSLIPGHVNLRSFLDTGRAIFDPSENIWSAGASSTFFTILGQSGEHSLTQLGFLSCFCGRLRVRLLRDVVCANCFSLHWQSFLNLLVHLF